jgi:hypothetical protein
MQGGKPIIPDFFVRDFLTGARFPGRPSGIIAFAINSFWLGVLKFPFVKEGL